jgi:hypothetical protein
MGDKMLTVGELKKRLAEVPDDVRVYYQRIEDSYFDRGGDWTTIDKHLIFNCYCNWETTMTKEEQEEHHKSYCHSHYVPAESAYKHEEGECFIINAHY